jgi:Uma2 family endonuclease
VVIRWNRAPTEADGTISEYLHEPPAIAVEIVSPGQSVTGVVEKCLWYMANGVEVAILVDPAVESVLMFRPGKEPVSIRGAGTIDLEDILPGFRLSAERLFAEVVIRKD